jgi:hypothetical protein
MLPLEKFKTLVENITSEGKVCILLLNEVKRGIMDLIYDHLSARHPRQDEMLRKT